MVTDISDIGDGFTLKRRRDNARRKKKTTDDGCAIPPPPVKHILSSFTFSSPRSKKAISEYVEVQAREKVHHAEKVKSEHVQGTDYDCWDVHTNKDRYWVITGPTNLYSHHYFPSLDYTLSFHIGVATRILSLQRGAPSPSHKSRFTPAWRRWEQAAQSCDTAEEGEDFQAVGMKCRESLIQFVRSLAKPEMVPQGKDIPKKADVDCWSQLIANTIAPGDHNRLVRGHLKAMAKSSWQLANWLTHASGATHSDAAFVLNATHNVINAFGTAIIRQESGSPERCPECGSYAIHVEYDSDLPTPYFSECTSCGWQRQES
jgi:hypothetical protein